MELLGQPSRGAQPPSLELIAFPLLIQTGHFRINAGEVKSDLDLLVEFVEKQDEPKTQTWIEKNFKGFRAEKTRALLKQAVESGRLRKTDEGKYTRPEAGRMLPLGTGFGTDPSEAGRMPDGSTDEELQASPY